MSVRGSTGWLKRSVALMASMMMAVVMIPQGAMGAESSERTVKDLSKDILTPQSVTGDDYENGRLVTWDTLWYGEYPQSEVVSEEVKKSYKAVDGKYLGDNDLVVSDKIYAYLKATDDWNKSGDIVVGAYRYHRVRSQDLPVAEDGTGKSGSDGKSTISAYNWGTDNSYHFFRYEPIRWRVLRKQDDTVLVISEKALDTMPYHEEEANAQWFNCSVRSWLNGDTASGNLVGVDYSGKGFVDLAFTDRQKKAILVTPTSEVDEQDTNDRIFFLTEAQVSGTADAVKYGFLKAGQKTDSARKALPSLYAKAKGAEYSVDEADAGSCAWWLRTTEERISQSYKINSDGTVGSASSADVNVAVRPAMKLDLSLVSNCYFAGTISSDGTDEPVDYPEKSTGVDSSIPLKDPIVENSGQLTAGQKTTWDTLWFGSYPKAEVVTAQQNSTYMNMDKKYLDTRDMIVSDTLYEKLRSADGWDDNGDLTLNGVKYRRIRKSDIKFKADYIAPLGYVWLDEDYHYFKYMPIKWRVLDTNGSTVLLMADEALDACPFDEQKDINHWKDVTIRSWLNGYGSSGNAAGVSYEKESFYGTAFTEAQQLQIQETQLDELDSEVSDKVFLLSTTQLTDEEFGFSGYELTRDEARRADSSLYAKVRGAVWTDREQFSGNVYWWRRSTHAQGNQISASLVSAYGDVGTEIAASTPAMAVRPALVLDLTFDGIARYAGTVSSDGMIEEIADDEQGGSDNGNTDIGKLISDPRIVRTAAVLEGQRVTWDCIAFGSYPQDEVITSQMGISYEAVSSKYLSSEDFIVSDEIYKMLQSATWDLDNETTILGIKYRRIRKEDAAGSTGSKTDTAYYWSDDSTWHYFQYQPIKWRVLQKSDGKALLLSDVLLDDQAYNTTGKACGWETCSLRNWLNGYEDYGSRNFLDTAFSSEEQSLIADTAVINLTNLFYRTESGGDTVDRLFLLSEAEAYHTQTAVRSGFVLSGDNNDEARRADSSAFAKAMGTSWDDSEKYFGKGIWSLRSPGNDRSHTACVYPAGYVSGQGISVADKTAGVRPAMWVTLTDAGSYRFGGTLSTVGTPAETETEKPTETETQKPTETETQKPTETEKPKPTETETQKPTETETPKPTETERPKPTETEAPKPTETETPKPTETEAPKPTETETPKPTETEAPKPTETETERTSESEKPTEKDQVIDQLPKVNKVTKISVNGSAHKLTAKRTMKLKAVVLPSNATYRAVRWSSSNTDYATVNSNGQVRAKVAGIGKKVTIKATAADGSGVYGTYKIKIKRDKTTKIKLSLQKKSTNKYYIKAKIYGTGSTVSKKLKWKSSNSKYAEVTSAGVIKIQKAGRGHKVKITAKATDGTGVKGTIKLRIR